MARAAHELAKAVANVEQRAPAQAAVERRVAVRNDEMFQPGNVGGNVGAPPHVGEIERHETVVDKIMQANRTAVACVQDAVGDAIADAEGPAVGLDLDQSPTSSTPSLTPSMVRVAALAHAVPDMAFTVAACPAMYLCAACAISPEPSAATGRCSRA